MPRVILVLSERGAATVKGMLIYVSNWVMLRFMDSAYGPPTTGGSKPEYSDRPVAQA